MSKQSNYISLRNGISTELIELGTQIEEALLSRGKNVSKECITKDIQWISDVLKKKKAVKYLRVVAEKPRDGKLISQRETFTVYLVQRREPACETHLRRELPKIWMLYFHPRFSK